MVERLGLAKAGQNIDDVVNNIPLNMQIQPVGRISRRSVPEARKNPVAAQFPAFT